jgi:pimeloyl-ACP methyl ester carboxylesterase
MAERFAIPARIRGKTPEGTGYIRAGVGEPLLLIHGVGMNATIWEPQIDLLKNRYDVIAIDMLGHGESPLPPEDAGLANYAEQGDRPARSSRLGKRLGRRPFDGRARRAGNRPARA